MSSKPTTATSCGMRLSIAKSVSISRTAVSSFPHTIASGRNPDAYSRFKSGRLSGLKSSRRTASPTRRRAISPATPKSLLLQFAFRRNTVPFIRNATLLRPRCRRCSATRRPADTLSMATRSHSLRPGGATTSESISTTGVSAFRKIRTTSRFEADSRSSMSGRKMTPSTCCTTSSRAIRRTRARVSATEPASSPRTTIP